MAKEKAPDFFVSAIAARLAMANLTAIRIHPQFSGYLAAVRAAASAGRSDNLKVNFQQFYQDYLLVAGAPPDSPFLQPFSERAKRAHLFNKNVAGSYAPSSLRGVAPILSVVKSSGSRQNVTHTLLPDHESRALRALAGSNRIPVHSLATFLFRDHRITRTADTDVESVANHFLKTFGYQLQDQSSRARFETLYQLDSDAFGIDGFAEP